MSLLFVKLILAPLIVLIATLLGRRLGPRAAGLFVGLPGTALPFLLTMYLTHGPHAATTTAAGGIAGQLICATYCIVIARTGARLRPVLAALVALAVAIGVGLARPTAQQCVCRRPPRPACLRRRPGHLAT